jgi:hypothetical protein
MTTPISLPAMTVRLFHTGLTQQGLPNTKSVFIPDLDTGLEYQLRKVPVYVPVGGHIDIPMSDHVFISYRQGAIKKFTDAGVITSFLFTQPSEFSNVTRPSPSTYPVGGMIWNTDDEAPNFSDGTNWRDAMGTIT